MGRFKSGFFMDWDIWKDKYSEIVYRLDLDPEMDRKAAELMGDIVGEVDISPLKSMVNGSECIVFGAGPSLETDLGKLSESGWLEKVLISTDGATSAVVEYKDPDIIVTDLDGEVDDEIEAWRRGSWMVVHAHGDNIDLVKRYVPQLDERVLGTIQVEKPAFLYNFGGFTDGDRAAFMAHELGAEKIYLAGMDLGREIGQHTGETERGQKIRKLEICGELLTWLAERFESNLINVTSEGKNIPRVPNSKIK